MKIMIEDIARRLLTPQETLDPQLFDYTQMMKEDIRQQILKKTEYIIEQTIGGIKGLELYDICLTGSAANYLYSEHSDIDIRIEIHNKNCPFLNKDARRFEEFLSAQAGAYHYQKNCDFIGKRLLDVKLAAKQIDLLGIYSVKKNKWRLYPNREATSNISLDELMEAYIARRDKIKTDVAKLKQTYSGVELGWQLNEYFYHQVAFHTNVKDYLTFKLLNYARYLKPIGADSIHAYNEGLSLFKSQKKGISQ